MQSQASSAMNSLSTPIPNIQTISFTAEEEKETSLIGKTNIEWGYSIEEMTSNGARKLRCIYCNKVFSGGRITHMKEHLAGQRGDVNRCKDVPQDI